MTSRERLLAALAIRPADRVPISTYELVGWDLQSWYNTHASYAPLMDLIRTKTDCVYMADLPGPDFGHPTDAYTTTSWREEEKQFTRTAWHTPKGDLTSLVRQDDPIFTTWRLEHLLKDIDDIDKYLSMGWTIRNEPDMSTFARTQKDLGEKGILLPSLSDPVCEGADLFEMGQFLILAMTETPKITYFLDAIHERQIAWLTAIMKAGVKAGVNWPHVLFRICGPEYATPPYASPEYFAQLVTPYVKRMSAVIHEYGAKVRIHSHGKIAKVLDEIMKMDPDALDPIEPPPDGDIELSEVKRRIGDRVCLFGNIELKLLENGKPEQVRDYVVKAMDQAKRGGGFVIMPTAAPINDPLAAKTEENYRVFIETALESGKF